MNITEINPNFIVSLELRDKVACESFKWVKNETLFFKKFVSVKEGFYENGHYDSVSSEELIKRGYLVKDKVVYKKPYVKFTMVNKKSSFKLRFDEIEEAKSFIQRFKSTYKQVGDLLISKNNLNIL